MRNINFLFFIFLFLFIVQNSYSFGLTSLNNKKLLALKKKNLNILNISGGKTFTSLKSSINNLNSLESASNNLNSKKSLSTTSNTSLFLSQFNTMTSTIKSSTSFLTGTIGLTVLFLLWYGFNAGCKFDIL